MWYAEQCNKTVPYAEVVQRRLKECVEEGCEKKYGIAQMQLKKVIKDELSLLPDAVSSNMFINHRHRFIFNAGGVKSGAWMGFIYDIEHFDKTGRVPVGSKDLNHTQLLQNCTLKSYLAARRGDSSNINNYFKFFIVRNPLSLLIARYIEHFGTLERSLFYQQGVPYHDVLEANNLQANLTRPVTLFEFLNWLLDIPMRDRPVEFRSQSEWLLPCKIRYDFTAMFEGMGFYKKLLIDKFKLDKALFYYDEIDFVYNKTAAFDYDQSYLGEVSEMGEADFKLQTSYLKKVMGSYRWDFVMYSYSMTRAKCYPYSETPGYWYGHTETDDPRPEVDPIFEGEYEWN